MAPVTRSQSPKSNSVYQPQKPPNPSRPLSRTIIALAALAALVFWHHVQCAYNTTTDVALETIPRYPLPLYDDLLALVAAWHQLPISSRRWQSTLLLLSHGDEVDKVIWDLLFKAGDIWSASEGFAKTPSVLPFHSRNDQGNSTYIDIAYLWRDTCPFPSWLRDQYSQSEQAKLSRSRSIYKMLGITIEALLNNAKEYAGQSPVDPAALLSSLQDRLSEFTTLRTAKGQEQYTSLAEDISRMLVCLNDTHGLVADAAARSVRKVNLVRMPWTDFILAPFKPGRAPLWSAVLFAAHLEIIELEMTGWKRALTGIHRLATVLEDLEKCEYALEAQLGELVAAVDGRRSIYTFLPDQNAWLTKLPTLRRDPKLDNCAHDTHSARMPPRAGLPECAPLYSGCHTDGGLPVGRGRRGGGQVVLQMPSPRNLELILSLTRDTVWRGKI